MNHISTMWRAQHAGLACYVCLDGNEQLVTVWYPSRSRLGGRIAVDAGSVRAILANYIRQEFGLPRSEDDATHFEWRAA
jgi:hypothetical protein